MAFSCERCEKEFTCKRNLIHHLQRQNKCWPKRVDSPDVQSLLTKITTKNVNEVNFPCKYCTQRFNSKSAMYKHSRKCKNNPQHNITNSGSKLTSDDASTSQTRHDFLESINDKLDMLTKAIHVQNITINTTNNNNIINTHNTNNITQTLNNFGNETTSHLSPEFLEHCLRNPKKGMSKLIENIHYNPDVPENHNLRCRSLKQNTFEKLVDEEWRICDASNTLDELIRKGYRILNAHYAENVQSDPTFFDDEDRVQMYERFRFLSDTSCNDYFAVKRDLRLLVKDRTMYLLASPETKLENEEIV
jgi:hypothetical protein